MSAVVVVSPEELRAIVREALREEMAEPSGEAGEARVITEADRARARKNLRRFGRGK